MSERVEGMLTYADGYKDGLAAQAAQIEALTLQRDALVDACRKALPELNRVSPSLSAPFIRAALAAVGDKHD